MYPTQLTSLLFTTSIAHAFSKQNYPIFFASLPLYTTTLIYHYTKFYTPDSTNTLLCKVDMFLCGVFYFSALYDYLTRKTIKAPYSTICLGLHIGLPLTFIASSRYSILMWSSDPQSSEFWHALFHTVIVFDTNLYLHNS
jgi:hypothetical protein